MRGVCTNLAYVATHADKLSACIINKYEGGAMTRAELYTLVHQVLEARAFLAVAEQRYSDLNNKLMQELSEKYPLEGGSDEQI